MGVRLKVSIGVVHAVEWAVDQHVRGPQTCHADGHAVVRTVLEVHVCTNLEPIGDVGTQLHVGAQCLVIITAQRTLIIQVAQREVIVALVTGTRDTDVIILVESRAGGIIIPIDGLASQVVGKHHGIDHRENTTEIDLGIRHLARSTTIGTPLAVADAVGQIVGIVVVAGGVLTATLVGGVFARSIKTIGAGLHIVLGKLEVFVGIHVAGEISDLHQTEFGTEADDGFAHLAFLRRNDDDAIGSLRTVNGSSRSILQDIDLSDVVGVDLGKLAVEGHAIEHDHRSAVADARHRTLATNLDGATALGRVLDTDIQARHTTQDVLHRAGSLILLVACLDLDYRSCEVLLAHRSVTYYDHILQNLGILTKGDLHVFCRLDLLRDVADEGNHQGGILAGLQ